MADSNSAMEPSNFIYLRTFPGSQSPYYAFVTCSAWQSGLYKIVLNNHEYAGPSPGYHHLDNRLPADSPTPSFFHMSPGKGPARIDDIKSLSQKYIIQWARDENVELQPLDLLQASRNDKRQGCLALYQTNENQDGFQRAFKFSPSSLCLEWEGSTAFSL